MQRAARLCIADVFSAQSAQLSAATEDSAATTATAAIDAEPAAVMQASVSLAAGESAQTATSALSSAAGTTTTSGARSGTAPTQTRFVSLGPLGVGAAWGELVWASVKADRKSDGAFGAPVHGDMPTLSLHHWAHRPDPTVLDGVQKQYAPHWGKVTPFGFTQLAGKIADLPAVPDTLALDYPGDFLRRPRQSGRTCL